MSALCVLACLRARTCAQLCVCVRARECAHASPGVCCLGHTLPWPRAVAGVGVCANTPVLCSAHVCRCAQTVWGLVSPHLSVGPPLGAERLHWVSVAAGGTRGWWQMRLCRSSSGLQGVRPSPDLLSRGSPAAEAWRPRWLPALCTASLWCRAALPFKEAREVGSGPEGGSGVWHRQAGAREGPHGRGACPLRG